MNDADKLIIIAQTYSYLKGNFTSAQLYDFLQNYDFKFHSKGLTTRKIGSQLSKSPKFIKIKNNPTKYKAI